jgi:uncharacterized protein YozE (UPF0346 family)
MKQTEENETVYYNIPETDIRLERDLSTGKATYCANFDNCIPDEEDFYYMRYRYLGDYTEDYRRVINEIQHYMEWFIGYSISISDFDEIRESYIKSLNTGLFKEKFMNQTVLNLPVDSIF